MTIPHSITGETLADEPEIDALNDEAFGPGRFARAAERVREGGPHDLSLSFVARSDGVLVGSVRLTRIDVGGSQGALLGPLAVRPHAKRHGVGGALIARGCEAAREAGLGYVLLVGDEPYYARHGFARVAGPAMPGPVDPARLLVRYLGPNGAEPPVGRVRHAVERGIIPATS